MIIYHQPPSPTFSYAAPAKSEPAAAAATPAAALVPIASDEVALVVQPSDDSHVAADAIAARAQRQRDRAARLQQKQQQQHSGADGSTELSALGVEMNHT